MIQSDRVGPGRQMRRSAGQGSVEPSRLHRSAVRRGPWWSHSLVVGSVVLVLYLVAAAVAYAHAWVHPSSVTALFGGSDPAQTIWYLRWVPYALQHGHNPLFTTVGNYPIGVNLMAQTSVLALGFVLSPVTVVFGPVASLNLALTLAFALSAGAGYLLCRRLVSWRPAAFVGGLLYGFSPYMVGQGVGHLNLVFVPLPALIFLALYEIVIDQKGSAVWWGALLALMVVVQFFVSTEVLATTAMFALLAFVAVMLVAAVGWRDALASHASHAALAVAVALLLAGAALAYPLYMLVAGPQHIQGSIAGYIDYFAVLSGPLVPTSLMLVGTAHLKRLGDEIAGGNQVENGTYLGVPLLLVFAVAVVLVRKAAVRMLAFMAALAFVLSLGVTFHGGPGDIRPGTTMPANWIYKIPLLNQAFPIRYSLYVSLFVAIVLALGLDALHWWLAARYAEGRRARVLPNVLPALVAAFALFPLIPAWPYPRQGPIEVPPYFTSSAIEAVPAGSVAVVYPIADGVDTRAQLW
ncbi:MAG: hypothetical protein J2O47_06545, partial [Acidimicrobiaceae bacterium]|nr:hypothetical protein [Acidimicrobiaceae bacterium]